jgi:hypothetical protein
LPTALVAIPVRCQPRAGLMGIGVS